MDRRYIEDGHLMIPNSDNMIEGYDLNEIEELIQKDKNYKTYRKNKKILNDIRKEYGDKTMLLQNSIDEMLDNFKYTEWRVFMYLVRISDFNNIVTTTQKEISKRLHILPQNVSASIRLLKKMGYITIKKTGAINSYYINPHVFWKGYLEDWFKVI